MKHSIKKLLKTTPLDIRLRVSIQYAYITLLSELGYRQGYWTPEEEDKLQKLCDFSDKHTQEILDIIKQYEEDFKK